MKRCCVFAYVLFLPLALLNAAEVATLTGGEPVVKSLPAFSLAAPAGPQFSDVKKQAQRDGGRTVLPLVLAAFSNGVESVRIPPGDYRFGAERWGRDGVEYALEFNGLRRDDVHPFTIDATGVTFWFDLPDDQAPHAHFSLGFKECSNIILCGATLDRGTRGHVEGRITQIDVAHNRLEIELSPGLTVPAAFNDKLEQRVLPFKADGRFCAPLYALQGGGIHLKYNGIIPSGRPGHYFVTMGDTKLLDTILDSQWRKMYGDLGTLEVGDGLSCVYTVSCAVELVRCRRMTMDRLQVYIPKGWGAEWGGDGGHLWKDCYFGPRPGTSQWQGGEGFMFCATRFGTTLDGIVMRHTGDDIANFHGYWGHIDKSAGNSVTFVRNGEFGRTIARDAAPGDRLLFRDKDTGRQIGDAIVVSSEGNVVFADREVESFTNAVVEWPDHACAGWRVQRCDFQDNYQRLLIQSGPGTVSNCVFARQGNGIEINSDFGYVEGGVAHDIIISCNTFADVNPQPGGGVVTMHVKAAEGALPLFSNIHIIGNTFIRPGATVIRLDRFSGGGIAGNRFVQAPLPRIDLKGCSGIREEDNLCLDAGK